MKKDRQKIIKFFPKATMRLDAFTDYLNMMYRQGYKLVNLKLDCFLYFEKVKTNDEYRYIILTEHYNRSGNKGKWNDIEYLEKRNPCFHNGNGELFFKIYGGVNVRYYIYLTRIVSNEDYAALNEFRKKRMKKNKCLTFCYRFNNRYISSNFNNLLYILFIKVQKWILQAKSINKFSVIGLLDDLFIPQIIYLLEDYVYE